MKSISSEDAIGDEQADATQTSNAIDDGRRQFLHNLHGYSEPPSQWQLSQLAALVGTNLPEDHSNLSINDAKRCVALASHIWDEAARMRKEIEIRLEKTKEAFDRTMPLYGSLKIGTHYLPRIDDWDTEDGTVPFKRYLAKVVGLAKEEDRVRWWRAFLTSKIRADRHRDR